MASPPSRPMSVASSSSPDQLPIQLVSKIIKALRASCIKESKTKKSVLATEWSWVEEKYHTYDIFPGVFDQGERSVCHFCSITSAAQMEVNASYVRNKRGKCNIRLHWEHLLTRFFELEGFKPGDYDAETRKMIEVQLIEREQGLYCWNDAAPWCFKHMGIKGEVDYGKKKTMVGESGCEEEPSGGKKPAKNVFMHLPGYSKEKAQKYLEQSALSKDQYTAEFVIDDYDYYYTISKDELHDYVKSGRAVVATIPAGGLFDELEADEIYSWLPIFDHQNNRWSDVPVMHSVVLVGNGNAGLEMMCEQFHPFLNSYGDDFANGGVGSVFYKSLFLGYYLIEMSGARKDDSFDWTELKHRPEVIKKIQKIPPPPPECPSSPQPLYVVTSPTHPQGQLPSPRSPAPETPCSTPRYVPPHLRHTSPPPYVPPHLRRTPPAGRASMY